MHEEFKNSGGNTHLTKHPFALIFKSFSHDKVPGRIYFPRNWNNSDKSDQNK